ncbi:MAG: HD domain-containing protein [Nitrospirota bacterium]|nr:HD domain-containing protein [Nitrospirota bacterium]MDH5768050.1 HD domain-containing protein [Nitrospirota bacterium]
MKKETEIELLDLILCLSDAMDFIDPALVSHHKQVAYIAFSIGTEMGLPMTQLKELVFSGGLHDIGAFSLKEKKGVMQFEIKNPFTHSEAGYLILNLFKALSYTARIVRFHHIPWSSVKGSEYKNQPVPLESHILHLSDRIAVLIDKKREVLGQTDKICRMINNSAGETFMPELVQVFNNLAIKEYFWLDLVSPDIRRVISNRLEPHSIKIASEDMLGFVQLFSKVIDFKSPFTATHSSGVAASAELLAKHYGFNEEECRMMRIAGYLHDLGKLTVPAEILDKPAKLWKKEFNVIRQHTFYTYRILETIPALQIINEWGAFHHERLDGSGYPFHLNAQDLPIGSQIMAVADIFTALAENRPYRTGMSQENALKILDEKVAHSAINKDIVFLLKQYYDEINAARATFQTDATREYKHIRKRLRDMENFRSNKEDRNFRT